MEIWKAVPGFEKYLEVSNEGKVRTIERFVSVNGGQRIQPSIELNPKVKSNGYLEISIRLGDQKRKWLLVHRIVAQAFLENPLNLPQVNHKDGDKTNNSSENLEWCTSAQNCNHAVKNKLAKTEEDHYKAKLTKEDITKIREDSRLHRIIAEDYGMARTTITAIKNNRTWKYVNERK